MKKLLKKLPFFVALFVLAGAVYAAVYSNHTQVTGITLGSSTPELDISSSDSGPWSGTVDAGSLGIDLSSIYPGWESPEYTLYLRNNSDAMPFDDVVVKITTPAITAWEELKEDVMMRVQEEGSLTWTSHSLDVWSRTPTGVLDSPLEAGNIRPVKIKFDMSSTATASGRTITFDIDFAGKK